MLRKVQYLHSSFLDLICNHDFTLFNQYILKSSSPHHWTTSESWLWLYTACCILQHILLRWRHQMQWRTFSVEKRKVLLWHVRAAAATQTAGSPLLCNRSIIYRRGTETKVSSQYQYKHWYQLCRYLDLYTFHATVVRFPLTCIDVLFIANCVCLKCAL